MLIMGLNKDANNPSKELELRTKSYQLQQHIHAMASEGLEWDGATVDKLVKLAVDMAVTSGKLDKTLADDKALTNFIKNTTAIAFNGLKQAMEAVSETSDLMGSMMLGSVRAVNGVQKALLREEMIGLYIYFMIYYFSKKYFFTFWTMPLMKPVGPIIGMEWMAKSALGVEPSKMTTFFMMFLFYLVWDREPLDPLINSMSSLVGMCRRRAAEAPNAAPVQQAPNAAPVQQAPNAANAAARAARNAAAQANYRIHYQAVINSGIHHERAPPFAVQRQINAIRQRAPAAARRGGRGRRTRKNKKQNRRRTRK